MNDNEIDENMNIEIDNSFQKPTYYDSKINELDQRYNLIMNELSKNVVNKINSNADEKNIERLQNEFFLLKNTILKDIENLSDNITYYDERLNKLLKQNNDLKKRFDEMKQKHTGSKGFARDTQVLYNQYLMGNYLIGLVTISSILIYQKYFTTSE
jgi:hypothetical protein